MNTPAHLLPGLKVIDQIYDAYMGCNSVPALEWERTPGLDPNPTAMGFLATAGRAAFRELGLPDKLWSSMIASGENATYITNYYFQYEREAELEAQSQIHWLRLYPQ